MIAITRPKEQASELARLILAYGGRPYIIPTIRIKPLIRGIDSFLESLTTADADYIIFMSANSIRLLTKRARGRKTAGRLKVMLRSAHLVAVGPKTSNELERYGVKVEIVPRSYTSEGVVEALKGKDLNGKTVLIPRAKGATPYLSKELKKLGAAVKEFFIYEPAPPSSRRAINRFVHDFTNGDIDAIIFTSSSTVKNLFKMISSQISMNRIMRLMKNRTDVVAIGPVTARTLEEIGIKPKIVPRRFLAAEAVHALVRYYKSR